MGRLINAIRWWMVKRLNVVIWALTPEPHRSNLRQIWTAQFDNFKKQDGGAHLAEMVLRQAEHTSEVGRLAAEWEREQVADHASARLAAEWDRQQNHQPTAEEARDLAERQRNVIRWPK